MSGANFAALYRKRFAMTGVERRNRVWQVLCKDFFNPLIGPDKDILDMACGYGEFINNVGAKSKIAIDLNPDTPMHLAPDVRFERTSVTKMASVASSSVDVVFTSNFLEHLPAKADCDSVFDEVLRVLRCGGRFIVLGPNIRFAYREYWDFYDHHLPLSDRSVQEAMEMKGFSVTKNIPRFLPYTMSGKTPSNDFLVRAYLRFPFAWRIMGRQFLVIGEKP
jgi:SAM-dependent methyltransferase